MAQGVPIDGGVSVDQGVPMAQGVPWNQGSPWIKESPQLEGSPWMEGSPQLKGSLRPERSPWIQGSPQLERSLWIEGSPWLKGSHGSRGPHRSRGPHQSSSRPPAPALDSPRSVRPRSIRPSVRAAGKAAATGSIKPKCFLFQTIKSHRAAAPRCCGVTLAARARVPTCRPSGRDTQIPERGTKSKPAAASAGRVEGLCPPRCGQAEGGDTGGGHSAQPVSPRRERQRRSTCSSATMSRCVNPGPASAGSPRPDGCGSACKQRAAPY